LDLKGEVFMKKVFMVSFLAVLLLILGVLLLPQVAGRAAPQQQAASGPSWNAIGVPLNVGAITADGVANYIDSGGSISQVGRWDAGSQSWVFRVVGSPFPPASYAVNTGDPLLVLADDTAPLSFAWTGDVPAYGTVSFSFSQNQWHFLIVPLDQNPAVISTADALATAIQAGASTSGMQVGRWDASSQSWVFRVVGSPFPPANYAVDLGYPYLVLTNTSTPTQWP